MLDDVYGTDSVIAVSFDQQTNAYQALTHVGFRTGKPGMSLVIAEGHGVFDFATRFQKRSGYRPSGISS